MSINSVSSPLSRKLKTHDDVIKWKHFPHYWPFVQGIHRSLVNSPHKGQWHGALMFSLICPWINGWVNNREAGDLRHHCAHYDVSVMPLLSLLNNSLTSGRCGSNFKSVFFKHTLWIRFMSTSCEIAFRWMPQNTFDVNSTLFQITAWYYQAMGYYLSQYWPSFITPHSIIGPQLVKHNDVIKRKHFPRYWPFVRGIHRSPVNSPHRGQWRGALMFSLICAWINGWVNNCEAGDLRGHRSQYDVTVMARMITKSQMLVIFPQFPQYIQSAK